MTPPRLPCALRVVPRPRRAPRRWASRSRRGVILLVALALLSLFSVIALTYVLVASQFRRTARSSAAASLRAQDTTALLDQAVLQVLSGTRNPRSVLGPHSLLEDLYGGDAYAGQIVGQGTAISHPVTAQNPQLVGQAMLIFDFSIDLGPDGRPGIGGVDDNGVSGIDDLGEVGWRGSDDNLFGRDVAYDPGPDGVPGSPGDDDGNGTADDALELGWPGSDDRELTQSGAPGFAGRDDDDDDGNGQDDNLGFVDYAPTGQPDFGEWGAPGSDDYRLSPINNYYNGRVLTFLSGPARGQSVRITGYEVQGGTYDLTADSSLTDTAGDTDASDNELDPRQPNGTDPLNPVQQFAVGKLRVTLPVGVSDPRDLIGSRFLINGRPFNGLGFGVSPQTVLRFKSETGPPALPASPQLLLGATASPLVNPFLPLTVPWERALLPNAAAFDRTPATWGPGALTARDVYIDPAGLGGADEDYDAVDYQNMLLAMRRTVFDYVAPATELSAPPIVEMPSLHRPDLLFYWYVRLARELQANPAAYGLGAPPSDQQAALMVLDPMGVYGTASGLPAVGQLLVTSLKRRVSLRPLRDDHPNFTGSNPAQSVYSPAALAAEIGSYAGTTLEDVMRRAWEVNGLGMPSTGPAAVGTSPINPAVYTVPQWDVDNDGDGAADSVWVDLGFPVQSSSDGRRYKPLVAILCVDMDGKLNLNAHGNLAQLPGAGDPAALNGGQTTVQYTAPFAGIGNAILSGVTPGYYGQGYGPADINLRLLFDFSDPVLGNREYYFLLRGQDDQAGFYYNGASFPTYANWPQPFGLDGRYGESNVYSASGTPNPPGGPGRTATTTYPFEEMRQAFAGLDSFLYDADIEIPSGSGASTRFTAAEPYNYRFGINRMLNLQPDGTGSIARPFVRLTGVYGSPSDVDGDGLLALDHRGQPMYLPAFDESGLVNPIAGTGFGERLTERLDDPYEVNLYGNARGAKYQVTVGGNTYISSRDNPYRYDELEALLRAYDADGGTLLNRLTLHAPSLFNNPRLRNIVTTDSWDLPVPGLPLTFDAAKTDLPVRNIAAFDFVAPGQAQVVDLLRAALARQDTASFPSATITPAPPNPFDPVGLLNPPPAASAAVDRDRTRLNLAVAQLLPPDVAAGLKFDLNRPLGNGRDDNLNNVIDEPSEMVRGVDVDTSGSLDNVTEVRNETALNDLDGDPDSEVPTGLNFPNYGYPLDTNGDGKLDGADYLVRQQYAKTLYVLLHLLHDTGLEPFVLDLIDDGAAGDGTLDDEEKARLFAQWAVNVVDYRDRDSIMTYFEYDIYPFRDDNTPPDGLPWDVDGFIGVAPGPDGAWGFRNTDDDGDGQVDEWDEQGFSGSDDVTSPDDGSIAFRGVVWGAERPELLITETLAFHDRRSTDDGVGGGTVAAMTDDDFDQAKRPKGSLFIELYHPGSTSTMQTPEGTQPAPPVELYDATLTGLQLNLTAPGGQPVWRLALAPGLESPNPTATPEPTSFNPLLDLTNITANRIWRVMYFADASGINDGAGLHFYPDSATNPYQVLAPGRYAVLGPKDFSWDNGAVEQRTTFLGRDNGSGVFPRKIVLDPTTSADQIDRLFIYDDGGTQRYPEEDPSSNDQTIQPPLVIVVDQATDVSGANQNTSGPTSNFRRFSVSEKSQGYGLFNTPPTGMIEGAYTPTDIPFDQDNTSTPNPPLVNYNNGTYLNYTTVYLQRLADPTLPYNAVSNPYLTVDQMSIDLTVYNGETASPADTSLPGALLTTKFDSRQRGDSGTRSMWTQLSRDPRRVTDIDGAEFGGDETAVSPPIPVATLGYLNMSLPYSGTAKTVPLPPAVAMPGTGEVSATSEFFGFGWRYHRDSTNGDKLPPVPGSITVADYYHQYVGDPDTTSVGFASGSTFPWLTWPNRPLISAYELLQVPAAGPSQLLGVPTSRASMATGRLGWNTRQANGEYWKPGVSPAPPQGLDLVELSFGHLAPWFLKEGAKLQEPAATDGPLQTGFQLPHPGPGMHRLLELVTVPTRFVGAEQWLDPEPNQDPDGTQRAFMADYSIAPLADGAYRQFEPGLETSGYALPFNRVSEFREPGRVNLNTIFDPLVWRGMTHDLAGANELFFWDQLWASRRGFDSPAVGGGGPPLDQWASSQRPLGKGVSADFDARSPSYFSNPFRGPGGNFLVPVNALRFDNLDPTQPGVRARTDLDVGLLRPLPTGLEPLFATTYVGATDTWHNTNQNPFFRYQFLTKLGNIATTRSNVYAVWITVGFFEVEPINVNLEPYKTQYAWADPTNAAVAPWGARELLRVFPDGFRLGQELGADTGTIRRQRAFYLIDRSIPVAFERGQVHNAKQAIVLQRVIQ